MGAMTLTEPSMDTDTREAELVQWAADLGARIEPFAAAHDRDLGRSQAHDSSRLSSSAQLTICARVCSPKRR